MSEEKLMEDPMFKPTKVATPYRGTTGAVNVSTSTERAEREAADGTVERRQRSILQLLGEAGPFGATVKELREATGEHHGQVSGSLSSMHAEGRIVALMNDRRNGCGVYVLPAHTLSRITRPFRPNRATASTPATLTAAEQELIDGFRSVVQRSGDSIVHLRPSTARSLLALVKRLSG